MKCHKHNESDAIGVCSICNKGICPDCFVEMEDRATCGSDICYESLKKTLAVINRNFENIDVWNPEPKYAPLACFIIGAFLLFVAISGDGHIGLNARSLIPAFFGISIIALGIRSYRRQKSLTDTD